ncbi:hypothetical protein FRC00_004098 [Tulasnella sp. 408]|nr:hypothetical protein FRC00_004098 [Tulasnella sp. 408]
MYSGEDIVFSGRDGQECEEFVRAIHKAGYAAGKLRDDAWMADLALTCLSGSALRYYASLEREVKRDWDLLRSALLERYPPPDGDEDEMQYWASRIKVIGANSEDFGYLGDGNTFYTNTDGIGAGASATEAIQVSYAPGNGLYEIEVQVGRYYYRPHTITPISHNLVSETTGNLKYWVFTGATRLPRRHLDRQSMDAAPPGPNNAYTVDCSYATITSFNYEGSYRSSKLNFDGPGYTRIWNVMADNTLCPHLEEQGCEYPESDHLL